jgi:2-polyprenyl-3-methyl-5-hydroxy-6-metoxy-1,4-benzoquinol methylase
LIETADLESSSDAYARRFSGPVGAWFLDVQAQATLELLQPFPQARVIELGGGHGQLAGPLADAGHAVTVYASSAACIDRVRTLVDAGRIAFASGPLLKAPYDAQSFDVAMAYRLLPHVHDWTGLLAELCRLARKAVIVDYPTSRSLNAVAGATFGLKKGVEKDTRPFRVFQDAEIEAALAAHGFRVTGRIGQFAVPMAAHRALGVAAVSKAAEGVAGALGLRKLLGSPVILRAERSAAAV